MEWEDVYDKLLGIMGRLNKREQRARSPQEPRSDNGTPEGVDPITAKVLARRQAHVSHRSIPPSG